VKASRASAGVTRSLRCFFQALLAHYGPQHWWPGDSCFEVIVGAILTQNTSWTNVERAIARLKAAGVLSVERLEALPETRLAELVRSSGYYNQKAGKLKAFLRYLRERHGGSLDRMFAHPTPELRRELLALPGIGEETADSILLYAGGRPLFVVDAYTRRILHRHYLLDRDASYQDIQDLFHRAIPPDAPIYNEFHALLVQAGKRHCLRAAPRCAGCPLERFPHRTESSA
jgi:endonuclease-3 related protein